jgi:hypothetical protein
MRKVKKTDDKIVKWVGCPLCGSNQTPDIMCTDVHVSWGTSVTEDGSLRRNKTIRKMGETPARSYVVCTACNGVVWDNVTVQTDNTVIRTTKVEAIVSTCPKCGTKVPV